MKWRVTLLLALSALSILIFSCGSPGPYSGALSPFGSGGASSSSGGTTPTPTPTTGVSTLASNCNSPYDIVTDGTYAYWTENVGSLGGKVRRIKLDGTETTPTDITTGLNNPHGISLSGSYIYFTQYVGDSGKISKVLKTGSAVAATDLATGLNYPAFCANYGGDCYFTECVATSGTLKKVSEAGGSVTTLASGLNSPWALAINGNNGDVYFTEYGGSGKIRKYTVSTALVSDIYTSAINAADIAINTASTVIIYWTEYTTAKVRKLTEGGTTPTDVVVTSPYGLIYLSGYLYFGENLSSGDVKKMSIDFTSSTTPTDLVTAQSYPFQFAGTGSTIIWTENPGGNGGTSLRIMKYSGS